MSTPAVSVVIPVRNMGATIATQLAALADQSFEGPWEIVVADNGSTDDTAAVVEQWRGRLPLTLVDASGPHSPAHAKNVGTAVAQGDALVFCDADDKVRPDWLAAMAGALSRSRLVTGPVAYTELNPSLIVAQYVRDESHVASGGSPQVAERFLPAAPGCNLGVQRALFDELNGFDDSVEAEDTDFCWRAQLAGEELVLEPLAVVDRRLKASSPREAFLINRARGAQIAALYRRFHKHGMTRSPIRDVAYDYLSIGLWLLRRQPYRAARVAGQRFGRLAGSIRHGVLFP